MKPMKMIIVFFGLIVFSVSLSGQSNPQKHHDLVRMGDSLYNAKDFKNSAFTYSAAFKENDWKATWHERYNAACSWALAKEADSAFSNLNYIPTFMNYTNLGHIKADPDLISLHNDK
jgi:hypothetical protein